MLRQVLAELRFHPSRFVGTLVAIAISVGFMAGSSVLVATEQNGVERQQSLPTAGADLVVTAGSTDPATVRRVLTGTAGVAAFEPSLVRRLNLRHDGMISLLNLVAVPSEPLRWSEIEQGRWPQEPGEVVLTRGAAAVLSAGVGQRISSGDRSYLVVGLTDEPGSLALQTGYVAAGEFARFGVDPATGTGTWLVGVDGDTAAEPVRQALAAAFAEYPGITVGSAAEQRADAVRQLAGKFDIFRNLLWAFAGIAAVVGMITIANTFTILLAQRRRQIGLLRAVGASGGQVRRRFLVEALVLGAIGSSVGVGMGIGLAVLGSLVTGSLYWGLRLPPRELTAAFLAGLLVTVCAAFFPVVRGTRVRPLEALQPEPGSDERLRPGVLRGVSCGALVATGVALGLGGLDSALALPVAVAGSVLVALGVIFGAVLFVPGLLRGLGAVVRPLGLTARLATQNAARNPRRAASTAMALMLTVGLMVTLEIGIASVNGAVLAGMDRSRPVDLKVGSWDTAVPLSGDLVEKLRAAPGVAGGVLLEATRADLTSGGRTRYQLPVVGLTPGVAGVARVPVAVGEHEVLVSPATRTASHGDRIRLAGRDATLELTVVKSNLARAGEVLVSSATLDRLGGGAASVLWLAVPDRAGAATAAGAVTELLDPARHYTAGAVVEAAVVEELLGIVLLVTSVLLGMAALIALLGVSNTLGLSVLERRRESALLRALGLQRRSLRAMLLVEALALAAVGVVVGVGAGVWFGWLGATAIARSLGVGPVSLQVDLPRAAGMVVTAVVAAVLASVLPGRRAAAASPTQALADN